MLCTNCHKNPATVHLYTTINGQRQEMDLCQNCFQELQRANQNFAAQNFMNNFNNDNLNNNEDNYMNQQFSTHQQQKAKTLLEEYGVDLTEMAGAGKIDPVVGREKEIARVIEILNRRTKNNPVLIGEAGVGKTAVVEGLAQQIVDGSVPKKLQNKKVIRLDVVSLVQGTGMRGQFEERMKRLMDELKKDDSIILFIDEIHEIVGAGNAEGGMDAGNIIKPALARGELQLVGATTLNEYRAIEKDSALERRLQPVQVKEPTTAETIEILTGIQPKYEAYHHVKYTPEAIAAAVNLSSRYIQDRFLPDKAIDLLDEAGSKVNLTIPLVDKKVVEERIEAGEKLKQEALMNEDYEKAAYYRDQIEKYKESTKNEFDADNIPQVTESMMEKIVEEKTNIPVGDLREQEQNQLINLSADLKQHLIGQDVAVEKVAKAIRRNRVGFNKTGRPIGSFLFVGPTGVGKTELAKQLALQLFGTKDNIIRFDMSEYMEKHSVSKLIGSPPGYVGYEEAGQLTEQVRRNPYSLILFDEVEKAHPDVLHLFLQILDDGHLTDSKGRTVSFKDTIIIMTSNAGQGVKEANVGFSATVNGISHSIMNRLNDYFKPEFLNRFDDIVEFNPLEKADLIKIIDLMIADTNNMIKDQGMSIKVTEPAKAKLVEIGYDRNMGARPLRRTIQEQIEDQVVDFYLENPNDKELEAKIENDQIKIAAKK